MASATWDEQERSEDWDPEPDRVGCLAILAGIVLVLAVCAGGVGYLVEGSWVGFVVGAAWVLGPSIFFALLLGGLLFFIFYCPTPS